MDDFFSNLDDSMEVEPPQLEPAFVAVLTSCLAKSLAGQQERPWTDAQESKMQESISTLVAAASGLGLKTFRVITIAPSGQKSTRELDVGRIASTRSLQ